MTEEHAEDAWLEGAISTAAALEANSREIYEILLRRGKNDGATRHIERLAAQKNVAVKRATDEEIEARAGGKSHGGVLARVGPRVFATLDDLLPKTNAAFVVMLDGIEDPFNFGQSVRSIHAAGADGLIVRPRNWTTAAGVVARASAGASERLPTAIAETAEDAAAFCKARGLQVAVSDDDPRGSVSIYDADLTCPLFLLIGGEKRGITRSFLEKADLRLRIPTARREALALGTAAAAAVLAFEIMRQRTRL